MTQSIIDEILAITIATSPFTDGAILRELFSEFNLSHKIQLKIAANKNTPADILESIYLSGQRNLIQQLASNPNTPVSILLELSKTINFVPKSFVNWSLVGNLLRNPSIPIAQLKRIAKHGGVSYLSYITENPSATTEILDIILDRLKRGWSGITTSMGEHATFKKALCHKNISLETLSEFATFLDSVVRQAVANSQRAWPELLATLANDREIYVREAAILNKNIRIEDAASGLLLYLNHKKPSLMQLEPVVERVNYKLKLLGFDETTLNVLSLETKLRIFT